MSLSRTRSMSMALKKSPVKAMSAIFPCCTFRFTRKRPPANRPCRSMENLGEAPNFLSQLSKCSAAS